MIRLRRFRHRMLIALPLLLVLAGGSADEQGPARFDWFDYRGENALAGKAREGFYANPVLPGFHPDPSVARVGDTFYLVTSTFAYFPGLPVFRSRDLVRWEQIGSAIDRPSQLNFDGIGLSRGVFAPSISHHDGVFRIVNTCVDCGGNFIITARDPAGPWSNPAWIRDVGGIDPSLFVDADGSAWLLNNDAPAGEPLYEGHRAIWIRRFDLKTNQTAGRAKMIVDGGVDISSKPIWAEGPHMFRRDGRYYLITAEGGTAEGHSEVVYRADQPEGPWTAYPKPILTQRDLDPARPNPITSAGHAEFVMTPKGDWWATFLAVRPYRGDYYNTGRETFLLPVRWRDGWPVVTRPGETVPAVAARPALPASLSPPDAVRDSFDAPAPALARSWLFVRAPRTRWWRIADGALEIAPRAQRIGEPGQPSFVARRQQHSHATAETSLRFDPLVPGAKAGLVAYQDDAHYYFVGLVNDGGRRVLRVERRASASDSVDGRVLASTPLPNRGALRLRIRARGGAYDFAYAADAGGWRTILPDADGTILSTKVAGGFVGATLGLYAYSPHPGPTYLPATMRIQR